MEGNISFVTIYLRQAFTALKLVWLAAKILDCNGDLTRYGINLLSFQTLIYIEITRFCSRSKFKTTSKECTAVINSIDLLANSNSFIILQDWQLRQILRRNLVINVIVLVANTYICNFVGLLAKESLTQKSIYTCYSLGQLTAI